MDCTSLESVLQINILKQLLAAITVSMSTFCVGYTFAYTAPALPTMTDSHFTQFTVTQDNASWVGALMPLAALVGAIFGGPLITYLGRKFTIHLSAIPNVLGWMLIGMANSTYMVYCGRILNGLAAGMSSLALPVYLGEMLHANVRGTLGLLPTLLSTIGLLTCYAIGWFTNWSQLAFIGAALCVPFIILMFFIPESPRWYVTRDKQEQAVKALTWLRPKDADISSELQEMGTRKSVVDDKPRWTEIFLRRNLKAVSISLGLMLFQQFSGINAVIFYTVEIFNAAGSTIDSNLCTIIVGAFNFVSVFAATMVIDRVGRKVLLYISDVTIVVTLAILSAFFFIHSRGTDTSRYGWLPLVCFIVYVIGFALGFGPIPWLMMGEILPSRIRGIAASVVVGFSKMCTFIVTKTFQDVISHIGIHGALALFCVSSIIGLFFIYFMVPETKHKSLEEIEDELTG